MYLALRVFGADRAATPADAATVAQVPQDAGGKKPAKKRGGGRRRPPSGGTVPGNTVSGDDSSWTNDDSSGGEELPAKLVALTPADRAMEWRGDDTTRPPQKVDMAGGAETRSLDDGEINATIGSQSGAAQSCFLQAATNTDLRGQMLVRMIVDGGGRVTKVKVQAPHYMFEHGALACVQRAAKAMHFPAVGGSTLVTMPINIT
jgi:TonB family protein